MSIILDFHCHALMVGSLCASNSANRHWITHFALSIVKPELCICKNSVPIASSMRGRSWIVRFGTFYFDTKAWFFYIHFKFIGCCLQH